MATSDSFELHLVKRLLPYGDGSGFRFTIEVLRHAEGESVRIHQHDDYTEILLAHWSEVRDAIDRMIQFANGEIQSELYEALSRALAGWGLEKSEPGLNLMEIEKQMKTALARARGEDRSHEGK